MGVVWVEVSMMSDMRGSAVGFDVGGGEGLGSVVGCVDEGGMGGWVGVFVCRCQ